MGCVCGAKSGEHLRLTNQAFEGACKLVCTHIREERTAYTPTQFERRQSEGGTGVKCFGHQAVADSSQLRMLNKLRSRRASENDC